MTQLTRRTEMAEDSIKDCIAPTIIDLYMSSSRQQTPPTVLHPDLPMPAIRRELRSRGIKFIHIKSKIENNIVYVVVGFKNAEDRRRCRTLISETHFTRFRYL
ncbi:unnamed protein product [Didymodactylos carnosus]|uniref:Uncharacterized protein n=1 Tax=Didymodactylos carnosus TaxID=1234261 RepID=A0A815Q5F5_9BILA|nr:unnamed protein product [Didymodactylos carnosus]CAF1457789.1 unnamed protein product [Didymodactylos carnosus]CAF4172302.1 unnamed protein product [Didymodactylos carnosus]CAF4329087.1 unnamed protein product [Didymodactylos carnosus]